MADVTAERDSRPATDASEKDGPPEPERPTTTARRYQPMRLRDLSRWPMPAAAGPGLVRLCLPVSHEWQVMPVHLQWIEDSTRRYGFEDPGEVLRHLIYVANSENQRVKGLIFRQIRCLHCHVGARGGQHRKVPLEATVHAFQYEWLVAVRERCGIKSVEKVVRIICDYYQSRVKQALIEGGSAASERRELELFGRNRETETGFLEATKALVPEERDGGEDEKKIDDPRGGVAAIVDENDDPAACSAEERAAAIARCQVGRNSSSYAVAAGETPEQTAERRSREAVIENSDETRRVRELMRRTKIYLG